MATSCIGIRSNANSTIIFLLVAFLVLLASAGVVGVGNGTQVGFRSGEELLGWQRIEAQLARVRNASVKTIQSPDGDVIDCVPTHLQPAFEHPKLRGQKPESEPVERPRIASVVHGHGHTDAAAMEGDGNEQGLQQTWTRSGESCPEGTIPVRRTTEDDVRRAGSVRRFGKKARGSYGLAQQEPSSFNHEYAVAIMPKSSYHGAKARLNVWPAKVASSPPGEFSLTQIWVISDQNSIETGWQVSPQIYGDNSPRLFVYWTKDDYQRTGWYNLLCSGFVQTRNQIVLGGAISRVSSYRGPQFDTTFMIYKVDRQQGNWWLEVDGVVVGYWPSSLFTHLAAGTADSVHFGGEVAMAPRAPGAPHTRTQMGSGQFAQTGYGRAAYVCNAEVVDSRFRLVSAAGPQFYANRPECYSIGGGNDAAWGTDFYYGGPGMNTWCP